MIDALTLDQLRVFVAVAEAGSFRGAAKRLQRAQSAVSFAIANLEGQLGVALFDRTSRTGLLTEAATALLQDARALLLKTESLKARGRGLAQGVEIAISLAVEPLYPPDRIAAALGVLRQRLPSVGIVVRSTPLGGPVEALMRRTATLAIILSDQIRDPAIEVDWLGDLPFNAVAGIGHPLANMSLERPLARDQLADHLQIVITDPTERTEMLDFGVTSPQTLRVTDLALKVALLEQGLGWGHLPTHIAAPLVRAGRLAPIRPADADPNGASCAPVFLGRRRDEPIGPAAALLRTALTETTIKSLGRSTSTR